jgi:hypothetical protein
MRKTMAFFMDAPSVHLLTREGISSGNEDPRRREVE